jgi:hypothetical protein
MPSRDLAGFCCLARGAIRADVAATRKGILNFSFLFLTLMRAAGPGRARPAAGARARPGLHRRLPGRADREGRHALPHLGYGGVDVVVEGATHGQAALFREWVPA